MEYKTLKDEELFAIINEYTDRLKKLQAMIADYMKLTIESGAQAASIHDEYRQLKEGIREIGHYVNLSRNTRGSSLYTTVFRPAFQGASAYGMMASAGSSINSKMLSSVEEAAYRLRKYMYLNEIEMDK